jgi:hypothetical protein
MSDPPNGYEPAELARTTRWTRGEWRQAYDQAISDGRLPWERVVRLVVDTDLGPSAVPAILALLDSYSPDEP